MTVTSQAHSARVCRARIHAGKLMRQAKPDDVFVFATLDEITQQLPAITRYLGHTRDFWVWLLSKWATRADR